MIDSRAKSISFQKCLIPSRTKSSNNLSRTWFSVYNCKPSLTYSFALVCVSRGEEIQGLTPTNLNKCIPLKERVSFYSCSHFLLHSMTYMEAMWLRSFKFYETFERF